MQTFYNNSLDQFLKEIKGIKLLTKDQIKRYLIDIRNGCSRSKHTFILSNLRLVISIAKNYVNKGLPLNDLIQEGTLGLIRAAEKFEIDKEIQFSTYATWWIKQKIRRALSNQVKMIKVPDHLYHRSIQLNDALYVSNKTQKEIENEVNLTSKQYLDLAQVAGPTLSLDAPSFYPDSNDDFSQTVSDDPYSSLNTNNIADNNLLKRQVYNMISELPQREQTVLRLRYGLDDGRPRTQKDIGCFLNVSAERVRQIESNAIGLLKENLV
ncbi:MAG: RNA polymerase sigma factor RpoD/SigA [Candidatus Margulisiibacteriota bacterium]